VRTPSLVGLYPPAWRDRYGDEMTALIELAPLRRRDRLDLVRGALDAWLHPSSPSRAPAVAALVGGGLWTVAAAAVVFQPVPPQWPGYLVEILGLALVSAAFLLAATLGCALRAGDRSGRVMAVAEGVAIAGYLAWIVAIAATAAGVLDGHWLAAAQTVAMLGTVLVGVVLVRRGDAVVGLLLMLGPVAMLIPWNVSWLVLGATWTVVGCVLVIDRSGGPGSRCQVS
jgi:hypothetical protein